jgi:hypothetical protein
MKYQDALEVLKNNPVVIDSHIGRYIPIKGLVEIRGNACAILDLNGLTQSLNCIEREGNNWFLTTYACGIHQFYGKETADEDVARFNESCTFKDNHITSISIF